MWPKVRDPLMILAVSLLIVTWMIESIPEPPPDPPTAQEQRDQKARDVAYGVRHRRDAVRLMNDGQYEDALARLKQAKRFDPDGATDPAVAQMFDDLLVATGFVIDDKWWPGPLPRPRPVTSISPGPPPDDPSEGPPSSPSPRGR
jgi:hypothetical protein